MKFIIILILFSSFSCASSQRRRGPDFSNMEREEIESTPKDTQKIKEPPAQRGTIELGLEGEATTETIIENGDSAEVPEVAEKVKAKLLDAPKINCEKFPDHEDCKKKKRDNDPNELILGAQSAPETP